MIRHDLPMFRRYILAFAALVLGSCMQKTVVVATAVPALESLLSELTSGSRIEVVNPLPPDLEITDQPTFWEEHGADADRLAERVSAVVGLRSIEPADVLYPRLRRRNIRVVEIDCARPADDAMRPLPLLHHRGSVNHFVWLSPGTIVAMAEIITSDLMQLVPASRPVLELNLQEVRRRYTGLRTEYLSHFSDVEQFSAVVLDPAYDYLLQEIGLFVVHRFPADETSWSAEHLSRLRQIHQSGMAQTLIHSWKPSGPTGILCDSLGLRIAVLHKGGIKLGNYESGLYGLVSANLQAIAAAFAVDSSGQ